MADKALDLVISYAAHPNGNVQGYDPLQTALDDGYRVVDVFTNPIPPGGAGTILGYCSVTVVLTKHFQGLNYRQTGTK